MYKIYHIIKRFSVQNPMIVYLQLNTLASLKISNELVKTKI